MMPRLKEVDQDRKAARAKGRKANILFHMDLILKEIKEIDSRREQLLKDYDKLTKQLRRLTDASEEEAGR
jgi:hypothetical protein